MPGSTRDDTSLLAVTWQEIPGNDVVSPLSAWGSYVISHRPNRHIVSYRPPGQHQHVGEYKTPEAAKEAAIAHYQNLKG